MYLDKMKNELNVDKFCICYVLWGNLIGSVVIFSVNRGPFVNKYCNVKEQRNSLLLMIQKVCLSKMDDIFIFFLKIFTSKKVL